KDYGDSELKLGLQGASLQIREFFTGDDQKNLSDTDADVGSSGPTLLPDQPGPTRHLLMPTGNAGVVYVIARDHMGGYRADGDAVVQKAALRGGGYGAMAYWNGHVYFASDNDFLHDFPLKEGRLVVAQPGKYSRVLFKNPGATPTVSANGTRDAIVWAVATRHWNGGE